jgi:hypothetical protein
MFLQSAVSSASIILHPFFKRINGTAKCPAPSERNIRPTEKLKCSCLLQVNTSGFSPKFSFFRSSVLESGGLYQVGTQTASLVGQTACPSTSHAAANL